MLSIYHQNTCPLKNISFTFEALISQAENTSRNRTI
jgi:hypothetical protein